jgi:hypothetical protein
MPALVPTDFVARIVWLGRVPNRAASLRSIAMDEVYAGFAGMEGEDHSGLTRESCSRVSAQYKRGTTIRNTRQFSIVSAEELDLIAKRIGADRIDPSWIGASIVLEGIPDFTHVPPSSRLQSVSGATLTVDLENRPCHLPAKVIDADAPGLGAAFKSAAKDRRGVTAWTEREGWLRVGDEVRLHIPEQRTWNGPSQTRTSPPNSIPKATPV